jgi:hypothetical protein
LGIIRTLVNLTETIHKRHNPKFLNVSHNFGDD